MISIVDPSDLQYVLRPTVYRPLGESADRTGPARRFADETTAVRSPSATPVSGVARISEPSR